MPFTLPVSGGIAQALISLEDREGHQVSPVPQLHRCSPRSRRCSGICWSHTGRNVTSFRCLTGPQSFSRFLRNSSLSAAVPVVDICCCRCVALEMLQQQKFQVPVTRGDVKPQRLQPTCDQSVSYQQHESVPLDAWHSWASGKTQEVNDFQPPTWDIRTSLGISNDRTLRCLISSVLTNLA